MKIGLPRKPVGNSHFITFCIAVWEYLFNGNFPFIDTDTVKWSRGPGGYAANAAAAGAAGSKGKTPDGNLLMLAITGLGSQLNPPLPDLLICSSVSKTSTTGGTPTVLGDTIYVAKYWTARRYTNEYYADGGANVNQTYAYFGAVLGDIAYGDNFRQANDGTQTELESLVPRYATVSTLENRQPPVSRRQAYIFVQDLGFGSGVVDPSGNPVTKVEMGPARMWSKVVNA